MICASVCFLVFVQNILIHLAERISLMQTATFWGGITFSVTPRKISADPIRRRTAICEHEF